MLAALNLSYLKLDHLINAKVVKGYAALFCPMQFGHHHTVTEKCWQNPALLYNHKT